MANYPKFHGVELLNDSTIKNLSVESLSTTTTLKSL